MSAKSILTWRVLPWKPLNPGEGMLAWGLLFAGAAASFFHFVMGIIFAFPLAGMAAILLLIGINRARARDLPNARAAGGVLMTLGVAAVAVSTYIGVSVSYKLALEIHMPELAARIAPLRFHDLPLFAFVSIFPMAFLTPGLEKWTNWSPHRRKVWKKLFAATPAAGLLIHQILAAIGFPLWA